MSSVSIKVNTDTDSELGGLIGRLDKISGIDKAGVMNAVAEGLQTSTQERFRTGTAPDGSRWTPSMRAQTGKGNTLVDSAGLKNSIQAKADASGAAVGTNKIYAATHQFGDERTIRAKQGKYLKFQVGDRTVYTPSVRVHIPARPFLGISDSDKEEIRELLEEVLKE